MNIAIGIGFLLIGIYFLFRIFSEKENKRDRVVFKNDIFLFELLFGKRYAYKTSVIFASIIEIFCGIAFLLKWIEL